MAVTVVAVVVTVVCVAVVSVMVVVVAVVVVVVCEIVVAVVVVVVAVVVVVVAVVLVAVGPAQTLQLTGHSEYILAGVQPPKDPIRPQFAGSSSSISWQGRHFS